MWVSLFWARISPDRKSLRPCQNTCSFPTHWGHSPIATNAAKFNLGYEFGGFMGLIENFLQIPCTPVRHLARESAHVADEVGARALVSLELQQFQVLGFFQQFGKG